MNKNKIVLLILGLILVGGGVTYILTSKETSSSPTNETPKSETASTESSTPVFGPTGTTGKSFIATIEGKSSDATVITGTIESDGKGQVHFSGTQGGDNAEYYLDSNQAFIFCQNGSCFRYAVNQSGLNVGDYELTDEDIAKYRDIAEYEGTIACDAGMCEVWKYNDEGADTKIFIDKETKLVSQVVGVKDGDTFTITYAYKDVTITIPSNVQEITGSFELGQ